MSTDPPRSVVARVLKFFLKTDQPAFIAAVVGLSIAFGHLVVFHAIYFSTRETPPLWQAIAGGTAMGLIILPGVFFAIARLTSHMSPWVALSTAAALMPCPIALWRLGPMGAGFDPFLVLAGCIAFVLGVFLAARAIVKRHGSLS